MFGVWAPGEDVAKLTAAVGGKHVVVIPEMWRDPSTGARGVYGDYLPDAQGEDVVAGIRTPKPIAAMAQEIAAPYSAGCRRGPRGRASDMTLRSARVTGPLRSIQS